MVKINTVRKEGGSRILAVSTVLPKNWLVVSMSVLKKTSKSVTIKIDKVK